MAERRMVAVLQISCYNSRFMHDEIPQNLPERTGRHLCVKCLAEVAAAEYLQNDYLCEACAGEDEYPLASTPDSAPDPGLQTIPAASESAE